MKTLSSAASCHAQDPLAASPRVALKELLRQRREERNARRARGWMCAISLVILVFVGLITWELCRTEALRLPAQNDVSNYAPACDDPRIRPFYGLAAS